jgi:hypothetical protein
LLLAPLTEALQIAIRDPTHHEEEGKEAEEEGEDQVVETFASSRRIKETQGEMVTATTATFTATGKKNVVSRRKRKPRERILEPTQLYTRRET